MSKQGKETISFKARDVECVRGEKPLFSGLSFYLKGGDALLIHGPNGSGKTSLLRILAGFLPPERGQFEWCGKATGKPGKVLTGLVNYIGHQNALKPHLTVRENLAFWAGLYGRHADINSAWNRAGLGELADFPVHFLSEGQKRRVNLARLVAIPLPLWLLDEPASNLDTKGQKLLARLIRDHRKEGGILIAATHQPLDAGKAKTLDLGKGRGT